MNGVVFEIKQYMVVFRQLETRNIEGTQVKMRGLVRCMGDEYTLEVYFLASDSYYPTPSYKDSEKKGSMFLPMEDMSTFVDILRNEKPIYGHLRPDKPEWTSVTTGSEPVGEGEDS